MPRIYRLMFEDVAIAAAQDLCFLPGAAGKIIKPIRAWLECTDTTLPAAQMLKVRARYLPATVTAGTSGSTSQTPAKTDPGDPTCSVSTAGLNNTGKATTSGTAFVLHQGGFYIYNGYDYVFLNPDPIGPSTAFVWELLGAPVASTKFSGGVEFSEEG